MPTADMTTAEFLAQPSETMIGHALFWNDEKNYGVIAGNTQRYVTVGMEIAPDEIGRRYIIENEQVSFTPLYAKGQHRAHNVVPINRGKVELPEGDYWEECIVAAFDRYRGIGYLKRPFGGDLFIRGRRYDDTIKPGVHVVARVVRPYRPSDQHWIAEDVQVIDTPTSTAMAEAFDKAKQ